uniref:Exuperantia RNAse H-like domain-containing protein n=1 Tax=Lygus hesperus TaxID=30085 RepID=A0A0K8TBH5_LYGHE
MSKDMDSGSKNFKDSLFVSWDVDTTGRRLLDDICNVGAYCNDFSMQQYIMPYKDIMLPMKRRHNLSTISIGVYRVLRDTITGKIVKTKSELFGLLDFIMKLEAQGKDRGIVLMCYERQKLAPYLLIEGLKRYDLLDRFKAVVKGFANCHEFIKVNCAQTMVTYSLKTLAKILLDKEPKKLHDAFERAKLVHEIVVHLSTGESSDPIKDLSLKMTPYIQAFEEVEKELSDYKLMLERQRTLKPIFEHMIKISSERKRAIVLRQYLTDANIDFQSLNLVVTEEQDMKQYLHSKIGGELPEKDLSDLETVVTKHFKHPEKDEVKEKVKPPKRVSRERNNKKSEKGANKKEKRNRTSENGVNDSKNDSPGNEVSAAPTKEQTAEGNSTQPEQSRTDVDAKTNGSASASPTHDSLVAKDESTSTIIDSDEAHKVDNSSVSNVQC